MENLWELKQLKIKEEIEIERKRLNDIYKQ